MAIAVNPILKGFNPDPSVVRVNDDYYIATSTFEWFPGVQIHHSTDLIHWKLIARPLNRLSQLDLIGVPDSCGVWAPCLSYNQGTFYLVYSNVKSFDGSWKDTPNYLITTDNIQGEWSDPVFLNASGFDGSLFHDNDGRKWYLSMLIDHRKGKFFGGIIMQEYHPIQKRLVGPVYHIFEGTELGFTEGPHLYQIDNFYYLITAEGGTEYGHAISIARAKDITGPYEIHPHNPIMSTKDDPDHELQKTGHGDLFQTQDGRWYTTFLTGRPLTKRGRCTLGRESAIQEIVWKSGWPYLKNGNRIPDVKVDVPDLQTSEYTVSNQIEHFNDSEMNIHFQSLRIPVNDQWLSLTERKGFLRLRGRDSLSSFHHQSLTARRVQAFDVEASTCLDFQPENFQQMAGMVVYYNTAHYHYLSVSTDEERKSRTLTITTCDNFKISEPLEKPLKIPKNGLVYLKAHFKRDTIQFYYGLSKADWKKIGPLLDGSILSDDYIMNGCDRLRPAFTGSFVGICCQDLTGMQKHADFNWFAYREIE